MAGERQSWNAAVTTYTCGSSHLRMRTGDEDRAHLNPGIRFT